MLPSGTLGGSLCGKGALDADGRHLGVQNILPRFFAAFLHSLSAASSSSSWSGSSGGHLATSAARQWCEACCRWCTSLSLLWKSVRHWPQSPLGA